MRIRRLFSLIGPYPYNPYLIFLLFFSLFISRLAPMISTLPQGPERRASAVATIVLSIIPALVFSTASILVKRYRIWSSKSTFFYVLEVAVMQSFVLFYNPALHNFVLKEFKYDYRAAISPTPIMFLGSLIVVLVFLALMHQAERKISLRLQSATEMIVQLEEDRQELIKADEVIRGETSRVLHDRVQSDLMVVGMNLRSISGISDSKINEIIATAISQLESVRTIEIKNIIQSLSPNLDAGGIISALNILVGQYQSSMDISFHVSEEIENLDSAKSLGVFRIIEQAILNSLIHGPAKQVHVKVTCSVDGQVEIVVSDDGPGAALKSASNGVGSAVIDSWVTILKGKKEIDSAPGFGYQLKVTFPR